MDFTPLREFMDGMAREHTSGNAIEVYLNGKRVFQHMSGYADLETKTPLDGTELYNIYSCSKVATVTAGMQLVEKGALHLEEPLSRYMPEFEHMKVRGEDGNLTVAKRPIYIADLFTMTAGFDYNLNAPGFVRAKGLTNGRMDTVEVIREVAKDPLSFEPGSHWQYSICHDVLAAVVSVVSGMKFRDYMKENIFKPLDMNSCTYHPTKEDISRMASQYLFVPNDGAVTDMVEAQISGDAKAGYFQNVGKDNGFIVGEEYDSGGAGIISNLSDYAKFAAALANGGLGLTGERILAQETVDMIRRNRLTTEQAKDFNWKQLEGFGYGLGVRTYMEQNPQKAVCSYGKIGWSGAAGATLMADRELNLGVFYAQHVLNPREEYYLPRLRCAIYSSLK